VSEAEEALYQRIKEATDLALQVSIVRTLILEDLVGRDRPKSKVEGVIRSLSPSFFVPSRTDLSTSESFRHFVKMKAQEVLSLSQRVD
jgi:hypothetical protein